ncbi:MAG: SurA N-terminal domain-containing protein [Caldimicrobium sp.]|nr:SurA N-terminal domain-containing protein [Caldimicrobium sp.]MCX7873863.1 SurA N-terminal domain-containing protein [Caldimicrobium sp.]MDW8094740.1 SurA N-terminal domain-containing protein [Caldimicrobium sp.]
MFEFLRKGATSIFAKIFLAIIVIVFIFWGIGTFDSPDREIVAKVNGDKITLREFQEYYNFKYIQLKQALGEMSEEDLKKMKFKDTLLEELIQMRLYRQMAKDLKVKITPEELRYAIAQMPIFQEAGAFNQRRYQAFLRELGLSSKSFERILETDLLRQKLYGLLSAPIITTREEVEAFYRFQNQMVSFLEFYLPQVTCESEVRYTEKDLENYYLAHRDRYVEEEKLKLAYYFLPFKGEIEVSEEDLKKYYQQNLNRFREPFKVKLRRIVVPGLDEAALRKAQEIKAQIKEIKDFTKFKADEGEWFEEEALPEDIKALIKIAKKGDILGPFPSAQGYIIIGIEEVQLERFLKFDEIKDKVKRELKEIRLKEKIRLRANEYYTGIVKENGLINWAKVKALPLVETSYLTKGDLAKLFFSQEIAQKLFKHNKGDYLSPIETEKGVYLVEIVDKTPKRNLKFEEAKSLVKVDYLKDKGKALCEERARNLLSKGKTNENLKDMAKELGFSVREKTQRRKDLPEVLISRGTPGLIEQPIWQENEIRIYVISRIEEGIEVVPEREYQIYREMLLELKRQEFLDKFIASYRAKAKIKVYPLFQQL